MVWTLLRRKPVPPPPAESPLTGAPSRLRVKTYSAATGYVYQYVYRGQRRIPAGAQEFVFSASRDRKEWRLVGISLGDGAVAQWQNSAKRELQNAERYAVAKLALFELFDATGAFDAAAGGVETNPVETTSAQIQRHLETLGRG